MHLASRNCVHILHRLNYNSVNPKCPIHSTRYVSAVMGGKSSKRAEPTGYTDKSVQQPCQSCAISGGLGLERGDGALSPQSARSQSRLTAYKLGQDRAKFIAVSTTEPHATSDCSALALPLLRPINHLLSRIRSDHKKTASSLGLFPHTASSQTTLCLLLLILETGH
jgi:hypothetical protein